MNIVFSKISSNIQDAEYENLQHFCVQIMSQKIKFHFDFS